MTMMISTLTSLIRDVWRSAPVPVITGWRTHDGESRRRKLAGEPPPSDDDEVVVHAPRPAERIVDDLVEQIGTARYARIGPVLPAGAGSELPWAFWVRATGSDGPFELRVGGHTRQATTDLRNAVILRIARPPRTLH